MESGLGVEPQAWELCEEASEETTMCVHVQHCTTLYDFYNVQVESGIDPLTPKVECEALLGLSPQLDDCSEGQ